MRVKVRLGDIGLVIPAGDGSMKVETFLATITSRFEAQGIKPGELRIAQLETGDGFLISSNDSLKDVVGDGESLVALDYDDWLKKELKNCKTTWLCLVREDFVDEVPKWIEVGLHVHNKLYVKWGLGWPHGKQPQNKRLELFDADSLQHFAKGGKVLIGNLSSEDGKWKAEAFFVVEKETVQAIELSVKSTSDPFPIVKRVGINVGRKLEKGEVTVIQSDYDDYDPATYKLPATERKGPSLEVKPKPQTTPSDGNRSTGDCPLNVTQKGEVEPDQAHYYKDRESWDNIFMSNFNLLNPTQEVIAITKVTSEYKKSDGSWEACKTSFGHRNGFYNYSWRHGETFFNMGEMQQTDMAIRSAIPIKAPQFEAQRRAHKSLPQPLEFRVTFEDSQKRTSVIQFSYVNEPLDLVTIEKRQKGYTAASNRGQPHDFWASLDDVELEARIFVEGFVNMENQRLEFCANETNRNKWLYVSTLKQIAYKAVAENKAEQEISDLCWTSDSGPTISAFAIVDLAKQRTYALKFVLTTSTGSLTEYFLIPKFPPKQEE